ncbi:MAG: hypothetical protein J6M90_07570 [Oscillospiraceae bacterium]|nr:hypothetical protein [Oscillospiraceae bacterium]
MSNDFYAEYMVTKRPSGGDTVKKVLLALAMLLVSAVLFLIFFPVGILLIFLVFYGGYYLFTGLYTEYEYIITNGTLDVDKISGKRSRKRLISADIAKFERFGLLSQAPDVPDGATTVLASSNDGAAEYYADYKHKSGGMVRLIFSPNDKIIDGIVMFLEPRMRIEVKRALQNSRAQADE